MTDQGNVFVDNNTDDQSGNDNNNNNEAATSELANVFTDKLMDITGDDGSPKYDSVEKALDALKASQEHIRNLENDNSQLKEKASKAEELEEVIKNMGNNDEGKPSEDTTPQGGLSADDVADLVKQTLEQERTSASMQANEKKVSEALTEKFGEKANEVVATKAKELGTTPKALGELSAQNPNMVLALFNDGKAPSSSPTTSTHNSNNEAPRQEELKRPDKSLLSGPAATDSNRKDLFKKIREEVYNKYDVTT